ncbi:MAG: hypothetical protein JO047_01655 [Alphaproteobacteria bacterium]|nr:hypothetical protein [Alphaproteobacteria bacterium]
MAEESRGAEHARPWIEQAKPEHWSLIDTEHRVADLYGMVNVPQAVWIDEAGRIVRPPETAGSTDHFRRMDRATRTMAPDDLAARLAARTAYLDAVRDWVLTGRYALPPDQARDRAPQVTPDIAQANAHFRLGLWLHRSARTEEATAQFEQASRLHPDSWTIWRQAADLRAVGEASGEAFWQRVDALGNHPYYPPPDLAGP